jgi:hypothetical protein
MSAFDATIAHLAEEDESLSLNHFAGDLIASVTGRYPECGLGWFPLNAGAYARMVAADPEVRIG